MSVPAVPTRSHVVVVGGGIAGLAAALAVLEALPAAQVTVLEGSDRLGGKLRREQVAGHLVDVGAESVLALRPEAVDLVARVGADAELVTPATTAASVWSRGALRPLPRATLMGVPSDPELGPRHPHRRRGGAARGRAALARRRARRGRLGRRLRRDPARRRRRRPARRAAARRGLRRPRPTAVAAGDDAGALGAGDPRREPGRRAAAPGIRGRCGAPRRPAAVRRSRAAGSAGCPSSSPTRSRARGATVRTGAVVRELQRTGTGWRLVARLRRRPRGGRGRCRARVPAPRRRPPGCSAAHAPRRRRRRWPASRRRRARWSRSPWSAPALGELPGSGFLVPPVEGRTIKAQHLHLPQVGLAGALSDVVVHLRASVGRDREEADLQRDDADLVAGRRRRARRGARPPAAAVVDAHVQRWGGGAAAVRRRPPRPGRRDPRRRRAPARRSRWRARRTTASASRPCIASAGRAATATVSTCAAPRPRTGDDPA